MQSVEYPKTENLFNRDPETHKLIVGDFRNPAFDQVKTWHVTEKIDGTNMRVLYSPWGGVEIRGRSDRAQVPGDLHETMRAMFPFDAMADQFDEFLQRDGREGGVTIFGEGFGPGIQKGGGDLAYEKTFRVFDVMYHWTQYEEIDGCREPRPQLNSWATMETVDMIVDGLGVKRAPVLDTAATMEDIVRGVRSGVESYTARQEKNVGMVLAEGIIARSDPYLYTARGSRVMFKLKGADLG